MKEEKKMDQLDEHETRVFQHGFVVGFMNGVRTITESPTWLPSRARASGAT